MAETESTNLLESCTFALECTENSHPFEPRTVTIEPMREKQIGRYRKKKSNSTLDETLLLFDNRILSHTHALIFFEEGKLYLKDLCSTNGTYLNGENIGPASEEASEPQARELKMGDVLRFGNLRAPDNNGDWIKPIEAKLTMKFTKSLHVEDGSNDSEKPPENFTPCEGRKTEQTTPEEQRPRKPFTPSALRSARKEKNYLQFCNTDERGTVTDEISRDTKSTQVLHAEKEERSTACDDCGSLAREFYVYRTRALRAIAFCLLIIICYQLYVKF